MSGLCKTFQLQYSPSRCPSYLLKAFRTIFKPGISTKENENCNRSRRGRKYYCNTPPDYEIRIIWLRLSQPERGPIFLHSAHFGVFFSAGLAGGRRRRWRRPRWRIKSGEKGVARKLLGGDTSCSKQKKFSDGNVQLTCENVDDSCPFLKRRQKEPSNVVNRTKGRTQFDRARLEEPSGDTGSNSCPLPPSPS